MDALHIIYWSMAGAGTLLTLGLLILGAEHEIGGGDIHVDFGHDVGIGEGHALGEGQGGPSVLSLTVIMAFVGGWGWGGLIGLDALHWGLFSLPSGLAVGFVMGLAVFSFMKFLYGQEATSTVGEAHLVGQEGVVLTTIPPGGTGEVRMNVRGTTIKCLARAESGDEIAAGTTVRAVQEVGGTLLVRAVRL